MNKVGTITGKIICLNSKPDDMPLVPGNHLSQKTKMAEKNTALANSGTEVVATEVTDMVRSSLEPSRMPDMMPSARESGIIRAKVQNPRMAVFHSLGHRTSATGTLKRMD